MIRFAMTSQATALTSWRVLSQSSSIACFSNHRLQTSRQYTTHDLYSSPPASLAVLMTLGVITGLLALVIWVASISMGMTCSIWYLSLTATLVTSFAGIAEEGRSEEWAGRSLV